MDGLMETRTIKYLNMIRKTDNVEIVYNRFLLRSEYSLKLFEYHSSQFQYVVDLFINNLKQGKKVYGMITSKKLGYFIREQITNSGFTCKFYHGDNLQVEGDDYLSH